MSDWNMKVNIDGETRRTLENMREHFNEYYAQKFAFDSIKENLPTLYETRVDWTLWRMFKKKFNEVE